jgi:hypothetical protein
MQEDRSVGPPFGVARPGSPEFEPQRRLLLELAVDPPAGGDELTDLAAVLDLSCRELEAAAAALERLGLCERSKGRLRATVPLRAVEALWPIAR